MIIQNSINTGGLPVQGSLPAPLPSGGGFPAVQGNPQGTSAATTGSPTSSGQVQQAVSTLNQSSSFLNRDLTFSVDNATHDTVVKVVEAQTGQVITQIPSKQALAMAQAIDALPQQGSLLSRKA